MRPSIIIEEKDIDAFNKKVNEAINDGYVVIIATATDKGCKAALTPEEYFASNSLAITGVGHD